VTQPSQIRYVKYFEKVFMGYMTTELKLEPSIVALDKLTMGCPKTSSYFRPYVEIYTVRDNRLVYSTIDPEKKKSPKKYKSKKMENEKAQIEIPLAGTKLPLIGDVLIKVYHMGKIPRYFS